MRVCSGRPKERRGNCGLISKRAFVYHTTFPPHPSPHRHRCIERPHGAVKLSTTFKHSGPLCVTASIRFPELERDLRSDDDWDALSCFVEQARNTRRIPHALNIQGHAWLRALGPTIKQTQTHAVVSLLSKIIYRCDTRTKYESWAEVGVMPLCSCSSPGVREDPAGVGGATFRPAPWRAVGTSAAVDTQTYSQYGEGADTGPL
jgi:hypothetical protein